MQTPKKDGSNYAVPLVEQLVDACPDRLTGSRSERRAQRMLREEFESVGLETELHRFRFNRSLYANFLLHFGLAVAASAVYIQSPLTAFALHLLVAISYVGDSTRRFYLLRRLFPYHQSQNLIGRHPATDELRLRIVVVAHADAAYTGRIFEPERLRTAARMPKLPFDLARKPLRLATAAVVALAGIDLATAALGGSIWFTAAALLATVPPLGVAFANLDVVLRDRVVPGANDNLTGCAGTVMLAERLGGRKPDDVELVFVASGAEESGGGGARALARDKVACGDWRPDETLVVGLDGLSNGELKYFREAELFTTAIPDGLLDALDDTQSKNARLESVEPHEIHAGSTDVLAFRAQGFPGVCLGCVDPDLGAPRHYHRPSDAPEHLEPDQIDRSVDFAEAFLRELMRAR